MGKLTYHVSRCGALVGCLILSGGFTVLAEQIRITGVVTDNIGEPLIGATVMVDGKNTGTATDIDGNYTIDADSKAQLKFSYVGYRPQTISVKGRNSINVQLLEDSELLDEVVVIGYGTMDKKELTSAISHVGEKDFLSVSATDPV
ncbi:MAG: carboxypeptidase-like regulatory domain-containing protein, partial [Muribaculaceae bacterium]|nr:carboxypeptidase-like regulatory domain-containing protein [Muribaculaceae bacterium]